MSIVIAFLTAFTLTADPPAKTDPKAEMMAADRAYAKITAEKGLDGWIEFLSDDAAKVRKAGEKIVAGKDAIRKQDAPLFADPKRQVTWEPLDAHAFADGKSGFTSGRYKVAGKGEDGKDQVFATGGYITWWRKESDGKWKVIFDTGTPDADVKKP
jgi:ketosteroid isomerase-like protein